jgi:hypothetical protein
MSATNNLPTLSLEAAKIASEAAQEKAKEMGIGMSMSMFMLRDPELHYYHQIYPSREGRKKNEKQFPCCIRNTRIT